MVAAQIAWDSASLGRTKEVLACYLSGLQVYLGVVGSAGLGSGLHAAVVAAVVCLVSPFVMPAAWTNRRPAGSGTACLCCPA